MVLAENFLFLSHSVIPNFSLKNHDSFGNMANFPLYAATFAITDLSHTITCLLQYERSLSRFCDEIVAVMN